MKGTDGKVQRHRQYTRLQLDIIDILYENKISESSQLSDLAINEAIKGIGPGKKQAVADNDIYNLQQIVDMSPQQEKDLIEHKLFSPDGVKNLKKKAEYFLDFAREYLSDTDI